MQAWHLPSLWAFLIKLTLKLMRYPCSIFCQTSWKTNYQVIMIVMAAFSLWRAHLSSQYVVAVDVFPALVYDAVTLLPVALVQGSPKNNMRTFNLTFPKFHTSLNFQIRSYIYQWSTIVLMNCHSNDVCQNIRTYFCPHYTVVLALLLWFQDHPIIHLSSDSRVKNK